LEYSYRAGVFYDGTHWNTVPEVLSQKDASQNDVLEPLFLALL
jgi:hypothetical protein